MTSHDDIITRQSLVGQTWADLGGSAAKPREVQKGAMPPIMEASHLQNNVWCRELSREAGWISTVEKIAFAFESS